MKDQNKNIKKDHNYDLEERCRVFAKSCRKFSKRIPRGVENTEDRKQLVRASGSIGANYIEANEAISKKDFTHRIKISRKESRECHFWLDLVDTGDDEELEKERILLMNEVMELMKIFGSIYQKSK